MCLFATDRLQKGERDFLSTNSTGCEPHRNPYLFYGSAFRRFDVLHGDFNAAPRFIVISGDFGKDEAYVSKKLACRAV